MVNILGIELSFGKQSRKTMRNEIEGFNLGEITLSETQQTQPSEQAVQQTQSGADITKRIDPSEFRLAYLGYGVLFRAINLRAIYLKGNGFDVVKHPDDRSEKNAKFCDSFLEKTGMKDYKLHQFSVNADVFGTAQLEVVFTKKGEAFDLALVNPESMDLMREGFDNRGFHNPNGPIVFLKEGKRTGEPEAWVQSYMESRVKKWKKIPWESIVYLKFNSLGDRWLGISLIQPMIKDIQRIMNITEGYAEAAYRHGFPKGVVYYGAPASAYNPEIRPTPEMKENAESFAKNVAMKDITLAPYYYKYEVTSPKITKVNLISDYFTDLVVATTGMPKNVLFGSAEEANFAAVKELNKNLAEDTKNRQMIIKDLFEHQLFPRILSKGSLIPKVVWREVSEDEDKEKVKVIYTLYQPPGASTGIITREEARLMLKEIIPFPDEEKIKEEQTFLKKNFPEEKKVDEEKTDEQRESEQQQKSNIRKRRSTEPQVEGQRNPIGDGTEPRSNRQFS